MIEILFSNDRFGIKGKLYADKGDIGQALFENIFLSGILLL